MKFFLIVYSVILLSGTCCNEVNDCHKYMSFYNSSNRDVYVEYEFNYPDTMAFIYGPNPALDPESSKVKSNQTTINPLLCRSCWEDRFISEIKSDTLMIYIYDAHVIETTPWDTVKAEYLVLKRYDLSLRDIQNLNWTITYP